VRLAHYPWAEIFALAVANCTLSGRNQSLLAGERIANSRTKHKKPVSQTTEYNLLNLRSIFRFFAVSINIFETKNIDYYIPIKQLIKPLQKYNILLSEKAYKWLP